jgi:hypothetical protein
MSGVGWLPRAGSTFGQLQYRWRSSRLSSFLVGRRGRAEICVRDADHGHVGDQRMHREEVLDLLGVDVHPARDDHV